MIDRAAHWSVDTRLNIAHLFATISMAAALFGYANAIDQRITRLEERSVAQRERDAQQDSQAAAALHLLRTELAEMRAEMREANRALQRYIERGQR